MLGVITRLIVMHFRAYFRSLLALAASVVLLSASSSTLSASVILAYTSPESTSNATVAATDVHAAVSGDVLSTGGGLTANSGSSYNWRGVIANGLTDLGQLIPAFPEVGDHAAVLLS